MSRDSPIKGTDFGRLAFEIFGLATQHTPRALTDESQPVGTEQLARRHRRANAETNNWQQ